jgi:hypothetical protein
MAENPINQHEPNTPNIHDIIESMPDSYVEGIIEKKYRKIPNVFVEHYSLVKVSLTRNYVNCSWSFGDSEDIIREGCFLYDNGEIEPVSGIFYAPNKIRFPMKYVTGLNIITEEAKANFKWFVEYAKNQFNKSFDPNRWLVRYFNNHIKIYNYGSLIKGRAIKFPLVKKIYELKVVEVPRLERPLGFEIVREIQVGEFKISFSNDVIKFKIYAFGGWAQLIYNKGNIGTTEVDVTYDVFGEKAHEQFTISRGNLYLFAQGRTPKSRNFLWARDIKFFKPE